MCGFCFEDFITYKLIFLFFAEKCLDSIYYQLYFNASFYSLFYTINLIFLQIFPRPFFFFPPFYLKIYKSNTGKNSNCFCSKINFLYFFIFCREMCGFYLKILFRTNSPSTHPFISPCPMFLRSILSS